MRRNVYSSFWRAAGKLPVPVGAVIRLTVPNVISPSVYQVDDRSPSIRCFLSVVSEPRRISPGSGEFILPAILCRGADESHLFERKLSLHPHCARLALVKQ